MDKMLKLIEDNDKLVVVQPLVKSALDVALNPEFSLTHAYYTITKGKKHFFTITYTDGHTWCFHWGNGSCSCIGEDTNALKKRVIDFLRDNGVFLELVGKPQNMTVFKNHMGFTCRIDGEFSTEEIIHIPEDVTDETEAVAWVLSRYGKIIK